MTNKTELLNFLDKKVFHPVLNAKSDNRGERDRKELQQLQQRTESEKARFHGYDSAERIVQMYKTEINSEAERPANARLRTSGCPRCRMCAMNSSGLRASGRRTRHPR